MEEQQVECMGLDTGTLCYCSLLGCWEEEWLNTAVYNLQKE